MTSITDKFILLTGGSRGIGPVIAAALAERGAHLALAARSEQDLQAVARSLEKFGRQVITIPVDLSQPDEPERLVARVLEQFGRIDILINNAGLETEGAFLDLPWQDICTTVQVNLLAPMALTYHVLPQMLERKQGHIVQIASVAAKGGSPYAATYCGTKAGLAEWTRGLRLELADSGVHFSTIFPGYVTEVGMFAKFKVSSPSMIGCCNPEQVARAVVRAIEKEKLEVIINSSPLTKPVFVLSEISPALGDWIFRTAGVVDFQRKKVAGKPAQES